MAVVESMMALYAKEVVTPDRVLAAVQRFNHGRSQAPAMPENHEQGLLLWVSNACEALKKRIEQDMGDGGGVTNGGEVLILLFISNCTLRKFFFNLINREID